jgi:hypothetical protein
LASWLPTRRGSKPGRRGKAHAGVSSNGKYIPLAIAVDFFANWRTYLQQRILDLRLRGKWRNRRFPCELRKNR